MRHSFTLTSHDAERFYKTLAKQYGLPERAGNRPYLSRNVQLVGDGEDRMIINIGIESMFQNGYVSRSTRLSMLIPESRCSEIELLAQRARVKLK